MMFSEPEDSSSLVFSSEASFLSLSKCFDFVMESVSENKSPLRSISPLPSINVMWWFSILSHLKVHLKERVQNRL